MNNEYKIIKEFKYNIQLLIDEVENKYGTKYNYPLGHLHMIKRIRDKFKRFVCEDFKDLNSMLCKVNRFMRYDFPTEFENRYIPRIDNENYHKYTEVYDNVENWISKFYYIIPKTEKYDFK